MIRKIFFFTSLTVVFVFSSSLAFAGDWKVYSGNGCTMNSPSTLTYHYGMALNNSEKTKIIRCPIVKDTGRILKASVRPIVYDPSSPVQCGLYSYLHQDTTNAFNISNEEKYLDKVFVTSRQMENGVMHFPKGVKGDIHDGFPGSKEQTAYFLDCRVPGKTDNRTMAGIISYSILEEDW